MKLVAFIRETSFLDANMDLSGYVFEHGTHNGYVAVPPENRYHGRSWEDMEEEINDLAIESLALLAPVASDLRKVIGTIKIATELERIGDYAKNIAKFMIKHDHLSDVIADYSISMEKDLIRMLEQALQCMVDQDEEAAFAIPERDNMINQQMQDIRAKLLPKENLEKEDILKELFEISAMLRNIERAGDHVKNICEHVLYMMKGQHYDFG